MAFLIPFIPMALELAEASFTMVELYTALVPGAAELSTVTTLISAGLDGGLTAAATETAITAGGELAATTAVRQGAAVAAKKALAKLTEEGAEIVAKKAGKTVIKKTFVKTVSKKIALFIAKFGIKGIFGIISLILSLTLLILQLFFHISIGAYVSKKVKEFIFGKLEERKIQLEKVLHFKVAGLVVRSIFRLGYDPYWQPQPDGSKIRRDALKLIDQKKIKAEKEKRKKKAKKDLLLIIKTLKNLGYESDDRLRTIKNLKRLIK